MPDYFVRWATTGTTRVRADTPEQAATHLVEHYAYGDDAEDTQVLSVIEAVPPQ